MKDLFYILAILPLIYEARIFKSPKKLISLTDEMNRITRDEENDEEFDMKHSLFVIFQLGYMVWAFIGLLKSDQYICFAFLFILTLVPTKKPLLIKIDAFLSFFTILFIVFNEYYFRLDLGQMIVNYFS